MSIAIIMETAIQVQVFQHEPLADPKTYLRLVRVLSVDPTRRFQVHCELSTWPFDEAPQFSAISYTWGEPTPVSTILVNGRRLDVGPNCEYVLKQTSSHVKEGYLWIDAVCINQSAGDNNDEKNAQVAMMGDVYKTATQVFACVGAHGDDSEFVYRMMRKDERLFRSWRSGSSVEWSGSRRISSIRYYPHLLAWKAKHRQTTIARLQEAFVLFMKRPYFHRVWIYQELFLAQHVSVLCGDDTIPISWVWVTCLALNAKFKSFDHMLYLSCFLQDEFSIVEEMLKSGATDSRSKTLKNTIREIASLQCQNPRDRIYGILSMIDWDGREPIQPDYSKDRLDLAMEALDHSYHGEVLTALMIRVEAIGKKLDLISRPSERLNESVQSRISTNLGKMNSKSPRIIAEETGRESTYLAGIQLSCCKGHWLFQEQLDEKDTPKMDQWDNGDTTTTQKLASDILLPPEAQDGDWLLFSNAVLASYKERTDLSWPVSFIAREHDSGLWELVGKALIASARGWSPRCIRLIKRRDPVFKVYVDSEDAFILLYSSGWQSILHEDPSWRWEEAIYDQYFRLRFCRERYSSFIVREP